MQLVLDLVNIGSIICNNDGPPTWLSTQPEKISHFACVKVMMNNDVADGNVMWSKDSVANQIFANTSPDSNGNSKNAIKFRCKFLKCAHRTHTHTPTHGRSNWSFSWCIHVCLCDDNKDMLYGIRRNSPILYVCIMRLATQNTSTQIELAYRGRWWRWWRGGGWTCTSILFMMRFESDTTDAMHTNWRKMKNCGAKRWNRGSE